MLEKESQYFNQHKAELISQYNGKYVVIVGEKVVGSYDSENEAYIQASKKYQDGGFLIKLCDTKEDSYTQTFHSRVSFT